MNSLTTLLWVASLCLTAGQGCYEQCQYDGNDSSDCRDYGLLDNTIFVPWYTGSQQCKDTYNIKITSPDVASVCASSNSFVNDLRFGYLSTSDARLGLGENAMTGGFFEQDFGRVVLKDSITIGGSTTDCEASQSSCYNAMKPYFGPGGAGEEEMEDVCSTMANQVQVDKQLEESILRGRLCQESRDGSTIPSSCDPLWSQLEDIMSDYPGRSCSFFQMGTQGRPIPACRTTQGNVRATNNKNKNAQADDSSTGGSLQHEAQPADDTTITAGQEEASQEEATISGAVGQRKSDLKQCAYLIQNVNSYNVENANQPPIDQCHEVSIDSSNEECQKCCSYSANEMMKDGYGGGFSVQYEVPIERGQPAPSEDAATCYAYVDALHDTLCSPYQGNFITSDNRFLVSQEACDAVYEQCVPTGIISSSFAGANGTTLCQKAWGTPCFKSQNSYPCQAGLTMEVVSKEIGITIVQPTHVVIVHYQEESHGTNPWQVSSIVGWSLLLIIIFVAACFCFTTNL